MCPLPAAPGDRERDGDTVPFLQQQSHHGCVQKQPRPVGKPTSLTKLLTFSANPRVQPGRFILSLVPGLWGQHWVWCPQVGLILLGDLGDCAWMWGTPHICKSINPPWGGLIQVCSPSPGVGHPRSAHRDLGGHGCRPRGHPQHRVPGLFGINPCPSQCILILKLPARG